MKLLSVPVNTEGIDYVVGDLHGTLGKLKDAMEAVDFNRETDRVFSVGDLIDRGPDSIDCLALIREPWFYCVRGNHEQMMIDAVFDPDPRLFQSQNTFHWFSNGGTWATEMLTQTGDWAPEFLRLVRESKELPISIEILNEEGVPVVGLCHAEPLIDWELHFDPTEHEEDRILWGRNVIEEPTYTCSGITQVYCGHTPCPDGPKDVGNIRFIDTGACFSKGYLTMEEIK